MKILKPLSIFLFCFFLNTNSYSEEVIADCSKIKNIVKKISCKTNLAKNKISSKFSSTHEKINSKKTLMDWFKKKEK